MSRRSSRSCNFFKKLVVGGVNRSKASVQNSCLTKLYHADAELKSISNELDSFDGKKDPQRCSLLVNQLRTAQDKVINLLFQLMDECNCERASRDYRMKFPDEILLAEGPESLNGQIWFGAECLSAGSNILNHNKESNLLRPMAKNLTMNLDALRTELRELIIDGDTIGRIGHQLIKKMSDFDKIFATFEYEYVRTMLPIRTASEIERLQEIAVLFSEALIDCVQRDLIKQDDIDEYQPIVMIALPRLAIVRGLLYDYDNPVYKAHKHHMSSLFKPFHGPLQSIRKLLKALKPNELYILETMLAKNESSSAAASQHCSQKLNFEIDLGSSPKSTIDEKHQDDSCKNQDQIDKIPDILNNLEPSTSGNKKIVDEKIHLDELLLRHSQQLHHRLFVAISGIADRLQVNFASDLRFILRQVFNTSEADSSNPKESKQDHQNDDGDDDEYDADEEQNYVSGQRRDRNSQASTLAASSSTAVEAAPHSHDDTNGSQSIEVAIEAREMVDLIDFSASNSDSSSPSSSSPSSSDRQGQNHGHIDDLLLAEPSIVDVNGENLANLLANQTQNHGDETIWLPSSQNFLNFSDATDYPNSLPAVSPPTLSAFNQQFDAAQSSHLSQAAGQQGLANNSDIVVGLNPAATILTPIPAPITPSIQGATISVQGNAPSTSALNTGLSSHRRHRYHSRHSQIHGTPQVHVPNQTQVTRPPPVWVPDQLVNSCTFCNSSFSFFKRRHHCRDCGQIFCGQCSKYTKNLQNLGYTNPQRVCVLCFQGGDGS